MDCYTSFQTLPLRNLIKYLGAFDPDYLAKEGVTAIPARFLEWAQRKIDDQIVDEFIPATLMFDEAILQELAQTKDGRSLRYNDRSFLAEYTDLLEEVGLFENETARYSRHVELLHGMVERKLDITIPMGTTVREFLEIMRSIEWPLTYKYTL